MSPNRRHKLRNRPATDATEEAVPEFIQAILKKYGGTLEPRPTTPPLHTQTRPRQPPADYAAESEKFRTDVMTTIRKQCAEQVALARTGQRSDALLNLDLLMTEVRTTIWDDMVLSTSLRKIIAHAQREVADLKPAGKVSNPDEPLRVTADGRCIYRGKKLVVKLAPGEARWMERCIELYHADGTEDFDQKEISLRVFGKATIRFAPSKIFRTSGPDVFFMIFEKTDSPGIITKKSGVVFEKPENG